jgi:hypothetical protein
MTADAIDTAAYVSGATAIARALGCAPVTVYRMARDGRLRVFRTGLRTSPLRVSREELRRLRRERRDGQR